MNEQEKREQVIKGLNELHAVACGLDGTQCYVNGIGIKQLQTLIDDATVLLKAQEPRVMTADEVARLTINICEWLWIEEAQRVTWNLHYMRAFVYSKHPDTGGFYIMANAHHDAVKLEGDDYGKTWRCWTSRPTDAQREAEPWPRA